jgi:DNA-binding HxlR family transcriptional regulator
MIAYSTYCPIAKAAEILTERWTLLVLRDLLLGASRFNDFRRSIPLMTPAILSKRLKTLQEVGIINRTPCKGGWEYQLTEAGSELKPLVDAAGEWGQRWARSKLPRGELHPSTLIWDIHRFLKTDNLPVGRTVVHVIFSDIVKMKLWWLVIRSGEVDVCLEDPGYEADLTINCNLLTLTQVFMGVIPLARTLKSGKLKLTGDFRLIKSMPLWFGLMPFSSVEPGASVQARP